MGYDSFASGDHCVNYSAEVASTRQLSQRSRLLGSDGAVIRRLSRCWGLLFPRTKMDDRRRFPLRLLDLHRADA